MGDRVVDCARLESVCAERHRGFESLPIRLLLRVLRFAGSVASKRLRQSRLGGFSQSLFCLTICLGRFLNKGFYDR